MKGCATLFNERAGRAGAAAPAIQRVRGNNALSLLGATDPSFLLLFLRVRAMAFTLFHEKAWRAYKVTHFSSFCLLPLIFLPPSSFLFLFFSFFFVVLSPSATAGLPLKRLFTRSLFRSTPFQINVAAKFLADREI